MRRRHSLAYYIVIYVIVQITMLSLAGLWISRFVINNVIFNKIGKEYPTHISDGGAVAMLVIGLSLLTLALVGMSLIFRYLNVQFKLTRLYDSFIANITHELKTPIASIQLYLDTMKTRKLDNEQRDKFLQNMEKDTEKLKNLINNILAVSRLEQKVQMYDCKIYNIQELSQKTIKILNNEFDIEVDFNNNLLEEGKIIFDEIAFRHIFKNLIDNSIKYSKDKTQIRITLSEKKKYFKLVFTDNGIGIPKHLHKKVFRKFYRGGNKYLPNVKGTGLGLFLIKEILKYHGGKIKIIKNIKSHGTSFQILIPVFKGKRRFLKNLLNN